MVREGTFRADLYYRLRGGQIALPSLRERRDDIPALVRHFLDDRELAVAPAAMDTLMAFDWPGNIRELRMVTTTLKGVAVDRVITGRTVSRLLGTEAGMVVDGTHLPSYREFKERVLREVERDYFEKVLARAGGNMTKAAVIAGMHRKNLYEKLGALGVPR
jgi:DNA-binding NtrC family response regulator